jgi:cytochrome bd-type quinol oxidase subunit 2
MYKKRTIFILLTSIFLFSVLAVTPLMAAIDLTSAITQLGTAAQFADTTPSLAQIVGGIIRIFLGLLGVLFMVYIVVGGFMWMTAKGNEEQITKAKAIITGSIAGLIAILISYALSVYVIDGITKAANLQTEGVESIKGQLTATGGQAGFETATEKVNLASTVGQIIKVFLMILGVVFMNTIIYSGYMWLMARGNEEQVTKAKATLNTSITGIIIVLIAYAITAFIVDRVTDAANYLA